MERIYYAGSSFLTGDAIAQAIMSYAKFLVAHRSSATIDIPIRHADGTEGRANFLLGPTSQLVSTTESSGLIELEDDALVASLRERASGLTLSDPRRINTTQNGDEAFRFVDLFELRGFVE